MRGAAASLLLVSLLPAAGCGDEALGAGPDADQVLAAVLAACEDADQVRLSDRLPAGHRSPREQEDAVVVPDREVELRSSRTEVDGDTATISATFEVAQAGEVVEVEQVIVLERTEAGEWVPTEPLVCPSPGAEPLPDGDP